MDILVKNNIIKKNKIIVDIGSKFTKVLEVNYKEPEKKEDEPVIDDVLPPLDDFFGELIPSNPDLTIPEEPIQTPAPEVTPVPSEEPEPTPPPEDKSINERLDSLLQQTSSFGNYKVVLLTNNNENFDVGSEMCLVYGLAETKQASFG